jgi:hypothetical protein
MTRLKPLLRDLVDWVEEAHWRRGPISSPFDQTLPPEALAWAEKAIELARTSSRPVILFTRRASPQSVVAGLALRGSGINVSTIYSGTLEDDDFSRLENWLVSAKTADITIEAEPFPRKQVVSLAISEGKFVLIC